MLPNRAVREDAPVDNHVVPRARSMVAPARKIGMHHARIGAYCIGALVPNACRIVHILRGEPAVPGTEVTVHRRLARARLGAYRYSTCQRTHLSARDGAGVARKHSGRSPCKGTRAQGLKGHAVALTGIEAVVDHVHGALGFQSKARHIND